VGKDDLSCGYSDIGTKVATDTQYTIPKSRHSDEDIHCHKKAEIMRKAMATILKHALENETDQIKYRIQQAISTKVDVGSDPILLVDKTNKMWMLQMKINVDELLQLKGEAETEDDANLKIYKSKVPWASIQYDKGPMNVP
jgi:hypothetical protein